MRKGFTLIELMIVIAIIAIIASIAIPNLLESRITANEGAAAASMKSAIFSSSVQFQAGGYQDSNNNGVGEYGHLQNMSGKAVCIGAALGDLGLLTGPLANQTLGDHVAIANNYNFSMFLPHIDGSGNALSDEGDALPVAGAGINDPQAERSYVCVAAPQTLNEVGRRVFAMAADGQLRSTNVIANRDTWFSTQSGKEVNRVTGEEMLIGMEDFLVANDNIDDIDTSAYPFYSK